MAVTISDELVENVARKMAEREGWSLPNDLELGYAPGSRVGKTMAAARLAVDVSAPLIANAQIEACAEIKEVWVLLYLHDWDQPKVGQNHRWEPGKNVFPEIHAYYDTWQEAEAVRANMINPKKYWVRKARAEDPDRVAAAIRALKEK